MSNKEFYTWTQAEPRALARYVQPANLPKALAWPSYLNRLDLLNAKGPLGVMTELYGLVQAQHIQYDLEPFNPQANATQLIRKPETIVQTKQATCLDLAMLLAALGLANDLLPVIVVVAGHALVGFSIRRTRRDTHKPPKFGAWEQGLLTDVAILRELTDQEYVWVEATGAAHSQSLNPKMPEGVGRTKGGSLPLERACEAGAEQLDGAREFLYALDIHALQTQFGFEPEPAEAQPPTTRSGPTTVIHGNVRGPVLSGEFHAPVNVGDINVGNITGSTGVAIGHGANVDIHQSKGLTEAEITRVIDSIRAKVDALPNTTQREGGQEAVQKLEAEAKKGDQADAGRVKRSMETVVAVLPDAWEVAVNTVLNPLAGINTFFSKIAERVKAEREKKQAP